MALAFDAVTGANISNNGSVTFAHTCTGTELALFVKVCQWSGNQSNNGVVSGVTYNGVAMTEVAASAFSGANDRVVIYRLVAPSTGSNNVIVTFESAGGTQNAGRIYAESYTGANQIDPEGTPTTDTGSSTSPSVTQSSAAGEFVIDGMAWDATTATASMTADTGRTQTGNATSNGEGGAASRHEQPTSSEAMAWTLSVSATWAEAAVNVIAAQSRSVQADYTRFPKPKIRELANRYAGGLGI